MQRVPETSMSKGNRCSRSLQIFGGYIFKTVVGNMLENKPGAAVGKRSCYCEIISNT